MTTSSTTEQTIANRDQAAAWNGPEGAHWARASERRVAHADLSQPVLNSAAIQPTDRILDVGCGIGDMTLDAARLAPHGSATGIDLSEAMIEQARTAAESAALPNARFIIGDAQVYGFAAGSFDVVVSHFGAMFFDDPLAAFVNLASALRPGGRLALCCPQPMDRCDWYREPLAALLGAPPTEASAPSRMFSLASQSKVEWLLHAAGFDSVHHRPIGARLWFGPDAATATDFYLGSGPVRAVLEHTPTLSEMIARERLQALMTRHLCEDGVRITGNHWLVTAERP